jgi:hypothetical protein
MIILVINAKLFIYQAFACIRSDRFYISYSTGLYRLYWNNNFSKYWRKTKAYQALHNS